MALSDQQIQQIFEEVYGRPGSPSELSAVSDLNAAQIENVLEESLANYNAKTYPPASNPPNPQVPPPPPPPPLPTSTGFIVTTGTGEPVPPSPPDPAILARNREVIDPATFVLPEGVTLAELQNIVEWQSRQTDPMFQTNIGERWREMGISNPTLQPGLLKTALEVYERGQRTEELTGNKAPWQDPDWRAKQDVIDAENAAYWEQRRRESANSPFVIGGGSSSGSNTPGISNNTRVPDSTITNTTATTVANQRSERLATTQRDIQYALNSYIRSNPSNFVRRRSGLPLLTPTQEAQRTQQINELSTAAAAAGAASQAAQTPVVIESNVTSNVAVAGVDSPTNTISSITTNNNAVISPESDAVVEKQNEIQLGAAPQTVARTSSTTVSNVVTSSLATTTGTLPTRPVAPSPASASDPLSTLATIAIAANLGAGVLSLFKRPGNVDVTTGTPTAGNQYSTVFDPETQTWGIWDNALGKFEQTGLNLQEAKVLEAVTENQGKIEVPLPPEFEVGVDTVGYPNQGPTFVSVFDPGTESWAVINERTGELVSTGLTEGEANVAALDEQSRLEAEQAVTDKPVDITTDYGTTQPTYVSSYDPETQTWGVWDNTSGQFVQTGLTEEESDINALDEQSRLEAEQSVTDDPVEITNQTGVVAVFDPETQTWGVWDNATGSFIETGLSEDEANVAALDEKTRQEAERSVTDDPVDITTDYGSSPGNNVVAVFDPETQTWGVWDNNTGTFLQTGLTEEEANVAVLDEQSRQDAENNFNDSNINNNEPVDNNSGTPAYGGNQFSVVGDGDGGYAVVDNDTGQFVSTGMTEDEAVALAARLNAENNQIDTGGPSQEEIDAAQQQAILAQAREQATLQAQTAFRDNGDWRVKLSLASGSTYLYNDTTDANAANSVLLPLRETGGVVFPYTPQIDINYKADYDQVALTHSNYKGYFYKGSYTDTISVSATFTAQDTQEANYLLAVIHFFRSVTKMFYGQDAQRGTPPPLVYLTGLGTFQFNAHPCVVSNFQYSLPNGVDYIRAMSVNVNGTDLVTRRPRQSVASNPISGAWARLQQLNSSQGISKGAELGWRPAPPVLGLNQPTYVPTKMDMNITLLPVQSRTQVSQQFSLQGYANGRLLAGGFW